MLLAAARRFLVLTVGVAGGTALIALAVGALAGSALDRAVSLGLYIVGSFMLVGGFFMGNRGPLRLKGDSTVLPFSRARRLRKATPEEREEAINTSAVFVSVGFVLILIAIATDSRFELF
jgi:hypothetical protein